MMKLTTLFAFLIISPCCPEVKKKKASDKPLFLTGTIPAVILTVLLAQTFLCQGLLHSQIFYNNGAAIWTGPTSIVQINGGLENNSSTSNGDIEHNGQMWVTLNSALPNAGDVTLNNNSILHGNGYYNVQQDWVNNATFTANNSTVELYGNVQEFITGTNVTTFHNLTLTGTGATVTDRKKSQTLDAIIDATGTLNINDRELETDVNTMFVMNPSVTAVDNDSSVAGSEGFVSSIVPGVLHRETNTVSSYVFPVGSSSNNLTRYRPIRVNPTAATATYYTVRFVNYDSDNDGFLRTSNDGVMCQTVDTFYHAIDPNPSAVVPADISIYYLNAVDGGIWNGTAHWRNNNSQWNNMSNITQSTSNGFDVDTRTNWLFANPGFPYLLTRLRPAPPSVTCQNLCANMPGVFTLTGGAGPYNWTIGGGTITNGQGTDSVNVNWGSTSGWIYVTDSSNAFCVSLPDSCFVTAYAVPVAGFDTVSLDPFNNTWNFIDSSNVPPLTWMWNFGDGDTSAQQSPIHYYPSSGTYTVTQIVMNQYGCLDTTYSVIVVNEGILIPNVFTPDGNGQNDVWYIPNSGVKEFHVTVFDRWGAKLWEATADEIRWDGRSLSGQLLTDGTYYYSIDFIFIRSSGEEMKNLTGTLTLLTSNR